MALLESPHFLTDTVNFINLKSIFIISDIMTH